MRVQDLRDSFREMCLRLGLTWTLTTQGWADVLLGLYSAPDRHYHGQRHIANLLDRLHVLKFGGFRSGLDRIAETEIAIWFHDAIYVVGSPHNEERSANLCRSFLVSVGLIELDPVPPPAGLPGMVHEAIMATKHDGLPIVGNAARLMVDLDLSGFADPWDVFEENNRRIRVEYAAVTDDAYRWGRIAFLAKLISRPIFNVLTELEASARANIKRHARELAEGGDGA